MSNDHDISANLLTVMVPNGVALQTRVLKVLTFQAVAMAIPRFSLDTRPSSIASYGLGGGKLDTAGLGGCG